ncbi:hypothetical protein KI387_031126, partial [Taxus chinensis]
YYGLSAFFSPAVFSLQNLVFVRRQLLSAAVRVGSPAEGGVGSGVGLLQIRNALKPVSLLIIPLTVSWIPQSLQLPSDENTDPNRSDEWTVVKCKKNSFSMHLRSH